MNVLPSTSLSDWPDIRVRRVPVKTSDITPALWYYAVMVRWDGTPPDGFDELNLWTMFGTQQGNGMVPESWGGWYIDGSTEEEWARICGDVLWREVE